MVYLVVAAVVAALALVGGVVWMGLPKGPTLKEVGHLSVPRIVEKAPQRVLVVEARGNPNTVARHAFGLVMKTYFKLAGVPRSGPEFPAPRARWDVDPGRPQEEWMGYYAMPVPDAVQEVPPVKGENELSVGLATWEYGTVAELLHVGRYDKEEDNIRALHGFIRSQGYEIVGMHEEEYLRGPGMLFRGNPDSYLTVIRYQVRKVGIGGR
jgi:hypothetical protein